MRTAIFDKEKSLFWTLIRDWFQKRKFCQNVSTTMTHINVKHAADVLIKLMIIKRGLIAVNSLHHSYFFKISVKSITFYASST